MKLTWQLVLAFALVLACWVGGAWILRAVFGMGPVAAIVAFGLMSVSTGAALGILVRWSPEGTP